LRIRSICASVLIGLLAGNAGNLQGLSMRGERNLLFKKLCAIAQTLEYDVAALTRGLPVLDCD
jgi:hypothetical protein